MRSRYTAYTRGHLDYLRKTWHVDNCPQNLTVPAGTNWLGLQIKAVVAGSADEAFGTVEFVARSKLNGRASRLHETSRFERVNGLWVYKDGTLNSR